MHFSTNALFEHLTHLIVLFFVVFADDFKTCRSDGKRKSFYAQALKRNCRNLILAVAARLNYNASSELRMFDYGILFELRIVDIRRFFRRFESRFRKTVRQILFERRRLRIVYAEFYAIGRVESRLRI